MFICGGSGGKSGGGGGGEPSSLPIQNNKKLSDLNKEYDQLTQKRDELLKKYTEMPSKHPDKKETFNQVNILRRKADNVMSKISDIEGPAW